MPQEDSEIPAEVPEADDPAGRARLPLWKVALIGLALLLIVAVLIGWFTRNSIADRLISSELDSLGVPGSYEIESIGAGRQVLRNILIGDKARPDLTIDRVIVRTEVRLGTPAFSSVELVNPRLYGTWRDGKLSFGSLDPLIFTGSDAPFSLPDMDLTLVDGRALIQGDMGDLGIKAEGSGNLRGGFAGELAAVAPSLAFADCKASGATFYAKISIASASPTLKGPLRLKSLSCADSGVALADAAIGVALTTDEALAEAQGVLDIATGRLSVGGSRAASTSGDVRYSWRDSKLTAQYDLSANTVATPHARAAALEAKGRMRTAEGLGRIELEGTLDGSGLAMSGDLAQSLADAGDALDGTMAAPLLDRVAGALRQELRGGSLSGAYVVRKTGEIVSAVVPQAAVRGRSGASLLSVSRLQVKAGGAGGLRATGNLATGGRNLPRITARMEQGESGRLTLHLRMPEYRADDASAALPRLVVVQSERGTLGFAGELVLSGPLPGGQGKGLIIPLDGNWSSQGGLALWRKCVDLRFDELALAGLTIRREGVPVCPARGQAIVRSGPGGLRIAGGVPSLNLAGTLGQTPVRITSGPMGIGWPGTLVARTLDVTLGPADTASHFRIAGVTADLGGSGIGGTFDGADILLDAVPLDIVDAGGNWRFADGALLLEQGAFTLKDRQKVARFQPLVARDASLRLAGNVITADALLREPESDREIVAVDLDHNLETAAGGARLHVAGIRFDEALQPDTLSWLALGVIANADGVVRGEGRIAWDADAVTSSGEFSTEDFDFAAAFGPVKGVSGTVRFTDLLNMVTAPDQKLDIASINPGIEVDNGVLTFEIRPGQVIAIKGAKWPFLDGTLRLQPVTMAVGSGDVLRYTLEIEGLNAARFVEQMDLGNLSATGTFDGTIPLVFDEDGGRIEGGSLRSRPPGGNVSYVGQLTYEDLSAMGNMAFDALKSLDYEQMDIALNGALEGEIVTNVRLRGVGQGVGTTGNFLTRHIAGQITKLPIQLNVNLRAPFFQLITSFKSMYDPTYVRDPRTLGLMDAQGRAIAKPDPEQLLPKAIQPSESGKMP